MATKRLSEKQQNVLEFINDFLDEHGFPPTVRDIQHGCRISSTSVVDYNLQILQRDGHIRRSPDISRGIEIVGRERGTVRQLEPLLVPLLGAIAAGQPLPALNDIPAEAAEMIELPRALGSGSRRLFALRVRGQSMIDALIDDGDIVVLEPVRNVRNGEMVAAWLKNEQEATLKRVYREGDRIRLQPANSQMQPIYTTADNVEVRGRVVSVIRHLEG
ncbi:MAG: transcriptional repressor LexA [Dehalococcoidia bacterium]|nr:transcriptional repressor LexA [Dehalococcoidia bacterium]